jgi:hypothetical protein
MNLLRKIAAAVRRGDLGTRVLNVLLQRPTKSRAVRRILQKRTGKSPSGSSTTCCYATPPW